ncbi:hypothetical protein ACFQL1_18535 [Halomicroarcula sp. GCM10025709]|uniref:hypothetical protein n=1 Tax=Halomicroarcula sp. GCM10025709 TaxID=3252669 RepID=UPI0036068162
MTSTVRRAAGFALVGTLALVVPLATAIRSPALSTVAATGPFVLVAALALTVVDPGSRLFDLFARPGDYEDGKLHGLAAFSLAAAGLALFAVQFGMPAWVFVGTVFVLAFGNLGQRLVATVRSDQFVATAAFVVAGFAAGLVGHVVGARLQTVAVELPSSCSWRRPGRWWPRCCAPSCSSATTRSFYSPSGSCCGCCSCLTRRSRHSESPSRWSSRRCLATSPTRWTRRRCPAC